jgi:ATP-binding cassette subfamily F protein 3
MMIVRLTKKIGEINATLADTALYDSDPGRIAMLGRERAHAGSTLAVAEEHWLALSAEYENALSAS